METQPPSKYVRGACNLCAAHGIDAHQRAHSCPFKDCECARCNVVRVRRTRVTQQLRMRRKERIASGSSDSSRSYNCNRCRNHGLPVEKKGHKNASSFSKCGCPMCTLCDSRSIMDANFRTSIRRKRGLKSSSPSTSSPDPMDCHPVPLSLSAPPAPAPVSPTLPSRPVMAPLPLNLVSAPNPFFMPEMVPTLTPSPEPSIQLVTIQSPFFVGNMSSIHQNLIAHALSQFPTGNQSNVYYLN